ncbi:TPA: GlyGly-CTERM sorting domain-containing protein [Escherichia coli]|uniref:GlyGly-CTERM sorting domain-containing protein n=1 Tax=Escherichia coli TaxID=562 RepID=UPI000DE51B1D|nr:GlyGly-CTERM sorting domain-containing protein [Escherichia coli]HCA9982391.1 GlyGly-CTERM sorting domain-containing protein [Klebsiella pneumoniae]EJM2046387.1 GlyGly-CTERM sorting domain-containing protein [Escherichia coli]EJM2163964.1 GlyGly-CTERM sorting domain-containing protein [Escherichia coli]ELG6449430.1 GlyGly-CTERM sorting domain-containing protein [Escherichia coli]
MQPSKNDSGAFFWFSLCFLVFLRFLRQKAIEGVLQGTYNGSYGKWIGFSGRFDRICRWV